MNYLPDALETLTLLFADDVKMVTRRSQSMNHHSSLTPAWDWSKRLSFFPDGSDTPIPVCNLVKDLGVQTDNMFSPCVQRTEAANKARRLIFMIKHSFQDLSKSAFIPLYEALVRPHLEHGMPAYSPNLVADINHPERIQRLAKRLVTGMRHLPYEERLQRLRADLITAFKIFKGLLDIDPNFFFLPPARRGLGGHPFKVIKGASHR